VGEEISRYLHGAYGLETTRFHGYQHTIYAMKLLNELYVAELNLSLIGLLQPTYGDKVNIPALWSLKQAISTSKDLKIFMF
jgi:hypothetical protein